MHRLQLMKGCEVKKYGFFQETQSMQKQLPQTIDKISS